MKTSRYSRALQAAFIGIAMSGSIIAARADIKDYEFQLVDKAIKAGADKIIAVRLKLPSPYQCSIWPLGFCIDSMTFISESIQSSASLTGSRATR